MTVDIDKSMLVGQPAERMSDLIEAELGGAATAPAATAVLYSSRSEEPTTGA
jgi:hypothetical protein